MKTILITGAGSGIGAAAAHSLAEEGNNRLIVVGRNEDKLNEVLAKLAHSEHHCVLAADVRNASAFREGLKNILGDGSLECVFANAGIGGENAYGVEDRWDEMKQGDVLLPRLKGKATFRRDVLPAKEHIQQAARRADCTKKHNFEIIAFHRIPPNNAKRSKGDGA